MLLVVFIIYDLIFNRFLNINNKDFNPKVKKSKQKINPTQSLFDRRTTCVLVTFGKVLLIFKLNSRVVVGEILRDFKKKMHLIQLTPIFFQYY